jgi:DNA polymerase-3 subunit epsilon
MKVLVFDTETTGLPKTKMMYPDTLHLWPHIVQFSYIIYDTIDNIIIQTSDYIIKLEENIIIPQESIKFHGITNEISSNLGININDVLIKFFKDLKTVDKIVGHNISFDINMVKVESLRIIYGNRLTDDVKINKDDLNYITNFKNVCCTLQDSIKLCNIEAMGKYGKPYLKYPKLIELHEKLFNTTPNNLHNSLNDILVTLRCYMKLKFNVDIINNCETFKNLTTLIF